MNSLISCATRGTETRRETFTHKTTCCSRRTRVPDQQAHSQRTSRVRPAGAQQRCRGGLRSSQRKSSSASAHYKARHQAKHVHTQQQGGGRTRGSGASSCRAWVTPPQATGACASCQTARPCTADAAARSPKVTLSSPSQDAVLRMTAELKSGTANSHRFFSFDFFCLPVFILRGTCQKLPVPVELPMPAGS